VTSTRRRVARRPAGPPSGATVAGNGASLDVQAGQTPGSAPAGTEDDVEAAVDSESTSAGHVPVKKKGTRKR
jgi:ribonuclease E